MFTLTAPIGMIIGFLPFSLFEKNVIKVLKNKAIIILIKLHITVTYTFIIIYLVFIILLKFKIISL